MVAAIRSHAGASNRLLVLALERRLTMLVSTPLLIEYEAVMTRAEHLAASGLDARQVSTILDAVAAVAGTMTALPPAAVIAAASRSARARAVLENPLGITLPFPLM